MKKLFIILILSGVYAFARAQVKDSQLWTGAMVKYNISKKFRLDFEQQLRFNNYISQYDYTFSELSLRYKVFKYLDIKALYRYSFIPQGETGSLDYDKSRISFDAATGTEIFNTGINIGYRIRYQYSRENSTGLTSNYIRNRVAIDYNLSKLVDPYADWEPYFKLDGKNKWRQHRYTLGLSWKINKKLNVDTYYRYQNEINVKKPETDFIIGLGVVYSIN
jgi:hypothetical protein